jgi:multidrug resistance protein
MSQSSRKQEIGPIIPHEPDMPATEPANGNLSLQYSVYTHHEKWLLVGIVAVAGLFSPLPANIYFPAIPKLTVVFDRSVEDLNLTVTIYLATQGCSPMLWGPLSDRYGRRPLFLLCILILIASSLGLAVCPESAFWLLMLLRALQAGGCASTVALGAGVVGDIASVSERGGFFGFFNLGPMLAPCIGPAIGGALSQYLGWRSIFWFIAIFASVCFALILVLLPETLRGLVGNGSIRPKHFVHRPLISVFGQEKATAVAYTSMGENSPTETQTTTNPFRLFTYADIVMTLTYTGVVYAVNYTITSTISSAFAVTYPYLNETHLGLCYLPTGLGMMVGSTINGKLLDRDYARLRKKSNESQDVNDQGTDEKNLQFPIEYARLRMTPALILVFVACIIGWGWCVQQKAHIAGPLVLQIASKSVCPPNLACVDAKEFQSATHQSPS